MALVKFIPEPGTPDTTEQFGIVFGPEPVEVTDPAIVRKCRASPFYEVDDGPVASGLRAVHKGFGKFTITDGTVTYDEGLSKPEADGFNALPDADKVAYVQK